MTERRLPKTAVENLVEDLASKANADLSNLDATGQEKFDAKANISLTNSPYTTNRILEIPQDIKLELNNGTVTLKAGSKVYVPNGFEADGTTPKFDAIVIPSDYVYNADFGINHSSLLSFGLDGKGVGLITSSWHSGTTAPTSDQFMLWYDTNTNKIKWTTDYGTTWTEWSICLPIARITIGDTYNVITSIDQVFNGFGYIGSTVFALPGVKVQIPDGRNLNGSYKSIEYTTERMAMYTFQSDWTTPYVYTLLIMDTVHPSLFVSTTVGLSENNYIVINGEENRTIKGIPLFGCSYTNGRINADYEPYTVDSVLNSNLSNLSAAGQAKFDEKANVSNTVTTNTNQTISGSKRFTKPAAGFSIELVADTNQQIVPATDTTNFLALYRNTSYTKGDGYTGWINCTRTASGITRSTLNVRKFLEGDSQQIINYVSAEITADGIPVAYTRTPPKNVSNDEIVTAGWVNSKMQVVSALPANPDPNVFYFIPG